MNDLFRDYIFFGVFISIFTYLFGVVIRKKIKFAIFNPLLLSVVFIIIFLKMTNVTYETYNGGAKYLSYLLTPATVCLSIPLYKQKALLKNNYKVILIGVVSGTIASMLSVLLLAFVFKFTHVQYVTLLPKSITTAIGMNVSEELGGIVTVTVAAIIMTGIMGNVIGDKVCKVFHIHNPIAKGLAMGTSSHAIGTAKALEMGPIEASTSSLAIVVAGLCTVIFAPIFAFLL